MAARSYRKTNRRAHQKTLLRIVPDHVYRWPRAASDIFQDVREDLRVRDELGGILDRTLWRTLKRLLAQNVIEHVGPPHGGQYQRVVSTGRER